jgi:hypothetical protein
MFDLKPLSKEAIPGALAKAERYRLLNEPEQAESICLDILAVDPENQPVLVHLILALTEQLHTGEAGRVSDAQALLVRLHREFDRHYYAGIICERRARSLLSHHSPGSGYVAFDWFQAAMKSYEVAQTMSRPGNEDAVLRWNTCARHLNRNPQIVPQPEERGEPMMLE